MNDFLNSRFVKDVSEITNNMYHQGWDERNGGNISYLIDEEYVREYFLKDKYIRVVDEGWGSPIKKIGNIIEDKWFDIDEFFKNYREENDNEEQKKDWLWRYCWNGYIFN